MQSPIKSLPCALCHKPVSLESAKADHNGKAVHEECYLQNLGTAAMRPMTRDEIQEESHALLSWLELIMDSLKRNRGLLTSADESELSVIQQRIDELREQLPSTIN
jgi:hypothetical protein